jgi:hypothetical protein
MSAPNLVQRIFNGSAPASGIAVLFCATALALTSGCNKPAPTTQVQKAPEKEDKPGTLELQFEDDTYKKSELFVDGRAHSLRVTDKKMPLPLAVGSHTVAFKFNGTEVYASTTTVKEQATTVLNVPTLTDPLGTLELKVARMDYELWAGVELFIDGKRTEYPPELTQDKPCKFRLKPGKHTVEFRRNGKEIWKGGQAMGVLEVVVKPSAEGETPLKVDIAAWLKVEASVVTIRNNVPLEKGVEAFVEVDGVYVKDWPVGGDRVAVTVAVGDRVIKVKTRKPADATIATFLVKINVNDPITLYTSK